jgi:serine/threonine protein kinase
MITMENEARFIFLAALERAPEQWPEYLKVACGENAALRARVEQFLEAHQALGSIHVRGSAPSPDATLQRPLPEQPGTQIGHYKLLEPIGEGGMGAVWMAQQTEPVKRLVAVKLIKPGLDSRQVIARFEAERQALALMEHPNIAKVLDAGAVGVPASAGLGGAEDPLKAGLQLGRPYFVMELVKGVPITRYCDEHHLTPRQRLELFVPVCQAIQHAHQKGIIHRDIKPSNVLVALYDDKPVPKIIDFGVAKATGQQLTERTLNTGFGAVVGTLEYMSPEQAGFNQLDIDTRSDIYSLGVLLYELLAGSPPFSRKDLADVGLLEMLRVIREQEPSKPSTKLSSSDALPSLSANRGTEPAKLAKLMRGELDWIVMKALEKDRARRYETANGFAQDLERYLADEPVLACPPSAAYRFRKWVRRNKRVFAAATAVALFLILGVVGLAVSNVLISQEKKEKEIALEEKEKALQAAKTNYEEARTQEALATKNATIANLRQMEAQANLNEALAAVDQMLTRVSEERLQHVPQMEPVRRELLQDALAFYQRFLERRKGDPTIRRETALAYGNMGSLHFQLGDYGQAEDAYRRAFDMFAELADESPLEPGIRSKLIQYHLGFSWVLRNQSKFEEGEKALRQAVALAEGLRQESPDVPLYRDQLVQSTNRLAAAIAAPGPTLFSTAQPTQLAEAEKIVRRNLTLTADTGRIWDRAQTYQNLSDILVKQRRLVEAEAACREGVLLFEQALAKSPSPQMQLGLARLLGELAGLVDANGRFQEAEELYRRAIPHYDQFAADFPEGPHNRWIQAKIHFQYGLLLSKLKRPTDAEQAFRRTVELFDKLANDFPTLPGYRPTAVDRRHHLAQFLAENGKKEEAQQVYDKAAGLLEELPAKERSNALKRRSAFYVGLGEWDKAAADLTTAIELGSEDVLGVWYPLAVLHLSAGRTNDYRALCETLLEKFGQSENFWVVVTCKLAPGEVSDLSRPRQIAEKLAAREPRNAEYVGILGDFLYRQGDLEGAVQKLEASVRDHRGVGIHWRKLCLAMAYHRLGRGAEAQKLLQEVTEWMETNAQKELFWAHRMDMQMLRREAQELLQQEFKKSENK